MPYELNPGEPFKSQGWKIKIREKERAEPPHVHVLKGTKSWRWNLRTKEFMDTDPPEKEVPDEIVVKLNEEYDNLKQNWDNKYPHNKV